MCDIHQIQTSFLVSGLIVIPQKKLKLKATSTYFIIIPPFYKKKKHRPKSPWHILYCHQKALFYQTIFL